jgi:glycosyltransferase involved in cell wall biosynthesis
VWHLHELGYEDHGLTFDFGPKISYKVINSASACLAVSEITAETFAKHIDRSKIRVIYQSVYRQPYWPDPNRPQPGEGAVPARRHKVRCVIVGRISEGKRQEDAVVAMADLKALGVDAELLIIGRSNPGYTEKLQALMRTHNVEDRVTIVGTVPDRMPFVQSADVVLMCSRCEAFGRVTVEGMLAGKPVVAANTGANPEIIREGFNGLMYKFGDTKDLADKIRYLDENPALAREIGKNGLTWSQSYYSKERYANELIPFLNGVVDRNGPVPAARVGEDGSLPCK